MDFDDDWDLAAPYGVTAAERDDEALERWYAAKKAEEAVKEKRDQYYYQPAFISAECSDAWHKHVDDRIVRKNGNVLLNKLIDVLGKIKDGATPCDIFSICIKEPRSIQFEIIYAIANFSKKGVDFATSVSDMLKAEKSKQPGDNGMTM